MPKNQVIEHNGEHSASKVWTMSIEDITELGDLFEYDEFDSYDEHAYQEIVSNNVSNEEGVPLSVELSESLNKVQTPNVNKLRKVLLKHQKYFWG